MELLQSKIIKLPKVFFINNKEDIKKLPVGVPFIYGEENIKNNIIRILEYESLYQAALKTGYPFNFKKILEEAGYKDLYEFEYVKTIYLDYVTEKKELLEEDLYHKSLKNNINLLKHFIKDSSAYVDIQKLKLLKVFPIWMDNIEKAINTNIHNFSVYNPNMYNKKLDGMYGGLEMTSPEKNLIIIDISGSIPRGVSSTCLTLAKNLSENFYADLMITGSKTTLYAYEELYKLNVDFIYDENGMDNDQQWFKKLVTSNVKKYKTAIVFGDNHSPCQDWRNIFNKRTKRISREDGKKMCKWDIENLISFHTTDNYRIAGYADWFLPKKVEIITDWVKYLN